MADSLGTFEQAVLLSIVRLGDQAYGRAILKEMQARLEREVAAGAVHATLERLQNKGLIASRLGSGTPVRGGRARRFYRLQPAGLRALNDARAAVDSLWHGLKWPLKGLRYDNGWHRPFGRICATARMGRGPLAHDPAAS